MVISQHTQVSIVTCEYLNIGVIFSAVTVAQISFKPQDKRAGLPGGVHKGSVQCIFAIKAHLYTPRLPLIGPALNLAPITLRCKLNMCSIQTMVPVDACYQTECTNCKKITWAVSCKNVGTLHAITDRPSRDAVRMWHKLREQDFICHFECVFDVFRLTDYARCEGGGQMYLCDRNQINK